MFDMMLYCIQWTALAIEYNMYTASIIHRALYSFRFRWPVPPGSLSAAGGPTSWRTCCMTEAKQIGDRPWVSVTGAAHPTRARPTRSCHIDGERSASIGGSRPDGHRRGVRVFERSRDTAAVQCQISGAYSVRDTPPTCAVGGFG